MTHQPRHHVPSSAERARLRAAVTAAPLLDLPEVTPSSPGRVLHVKAVGLLDDPHIPYIRLADGALYRLPEILRPWTQSFITVHLTGVQHNRPPMVPALIAFGVQGGRALADVQQTGPSTPH